jgi:2-isopropylmalate synthase
MTSTEKLEVARTLARLGVDVIEAGFPAASPDDLRAVRAIAEEVGDRVIVCGLARAARHDIDCCVKALEPAANRRIHTFLATSPIHREHKLRMSKEQVLAKITEMVAYARSQCEDIEFSCEDAGRTELDFLVQAVQAAVDAGATTLNIPDTVGYMTPAEFGERIATLKRAVRGIDDVVISVHCHNDLGLATANTLAGIYAGARQAEVTINGIGERAGNTALEEIVMALRTRGDHFGLTTGVDATQLARASRLVSTVTGMVVQPNKAIVGANAFAHEAGIHQDGMLKHEATYEIMRPADVGVSATKLVLGKHSGRHAFADRLAELGYALDNDELQRAFGRFKALADRKKTITNADLEALVTSEIIAPKAAYQLEALQVGCGTMGMPTATVRVTGPNGETTLHAAIGTGPVDATFKALELAIGGADCELLEYLVHAVTEGIDALGEVTVRVRRGERMIHGHGADTDIIVASAKAYLSALNRLIAMGDAGTVKAQGDALALRTGT